LGKWCKNSSSKQTMLRRGRAGREGGEGGEQGRYREREREQTYKFTTCQVSLGRVVFGHLEDNVIEGKGRMAWPEGREWTVRRTGYIY